MPNMLLFSIPVPLAYNTWVNVVMLGEKIADMIKEDCGYPTGGPDPIAGNDTIPDPIPTGNSDGSSGGKRHRKKSRSGKRNRKNSHRKHED